MLEVVPVPSPVSPVAPADRATPAVVAEELAWCLERFVTARVDEPTMERARQALEAWGQVETASRSIAEPRERPRSSAHSPL